MTLSTILTGILPSASSASLQRWMGKDRWLRPPASSLGAVLRPAHGRRYPVPALPRGRPRTWASPFLTGLPSASACAISRAPTGARMSRTMPCPPAASVLMSWPASRSSRKGLMVGLCPTVCRHRRPHRRHLVPSRLSPARRSLLDCARARSADDLHVGPRRFPAHHQGFGIQPAEFLLPCMIGCSCTVARSFASRAAGGVALEDSAPPPHVPSAQRRPVGHRLTCCSSSTPTTWVPWHRFSRSPSSES